LAKRLKTCGLLLALGLAMPGLGAAARAPATRTAVATVLLMPAADLRAGPQGLELVLPMSRTLSPKAFRLARPDRLVIDLAGARPAPGWRLPGPQGAVRALRGALQGRAYRIVLDLQPGLRGVPRWQLEPAGATTRLHVLLGAAPPAGAASPGPGPGAATPGTSSASPADLPRSRLAEPGTVREAPQGQRDIVVVIDAGHGGKDPGSSGPDGTHEKDVVLPIARALAARLNAEAGVRAVLTRDTDRFIELRERMDAARDARADLFISVHADAVLNHEITGASVYTLSSRGASSEAARFLADRENEAVLKGVVNLGGVNPDLASLLLDVSQTANMGASVEAADEVLTALDRVGAVRKREVQHAAFVVLKSPDVPSMLVETAYISNPAEERKLRTASWQQQLAGAIAGGVVGYFRRHPPDGTAYAAQRRP
jgi:N-acetylmuramoyl-L-alanine amidase